ncbi:MAG: hypothetical protein L0241_25265 [Planctomycetia bacterium]|nr:hypothetical protein [Planctomycetia bacterium]
MRVKASLSLCTVFVICLLASSGRVPVLGQPGTQPKGVEDDRVPIQATIRTIPVDLGEGKWPRTFDLRFCRNSSASVVYVFPVFVVKDITFVPVGGKAKGLFTQTGEIDADFFNPAVSAVKVEFVDLFLDKLGREFIEAELRKQPKVNNETEFTEPEMPGQFTVRLVVDDPTTGKPVELGVKEFTHLRDVERVFALSPDSKAKLAGANDKTVRLEATFGYQAEFSEPNYRITISNVTRGLDKVSSHFRALPDDRRSEFILSAAGGSVEGKLGLSRALTQFFTLRFAEFREDQKIDPKLVERSLELVLAKTFEEVQLREIDGKKMVTFLMSNQIRMTAPLSVFREINEESVKKVVDKAIEHDKAAKEGKVKVDVEVEVDSGLVGIGASVTTRASTLVEDKQYTERFRDRLREDFAAAKKSAKGEIKSVTAMRVDQLLAFANEDAVEKVVEFIRVKRGEAQLNLPIPLSKRIGSGPADYSRELAELKAQVTALDKGLPNRFEAVSKAASAEVTTLSNRITPLERHFTSSEDHAVLVSGLKNPGGKSFALLLTPRGKLVLRENNPANKDGWDGQREVFKYR